MDHPRDLVVLVPYGNRFAVVARVATSMLGWLLYVQHLASWWGSGWLIPMRCGVPCGWVVCEVALGSALWVWVCTAAPLGARHAPCPQWGIGAGVGVSL